MQTFFSRFKISIRSKPLPHGLKIHSKITTFFPPAAYKQPNTGSGVPEPYQLGYRFPGYGATCLFLDFGTRFAQRSLNPYYSPHIVKNWRQAKQKEREKTRYESHISQFIRPWNCVPVWCAATIPVAVGFCLLGPPGRERSWRQKFPKNRLQVSTYLFWYTSFGAIYFSESSGTANRKKLKGGGNWKSHKSANLFRCLCLCHRYW